MRHPLSILIVVVLVLGFAAGARAEPIVHSVFFTLKHEAGSKAEEAFLKQARALAKIPGVEGFQVLRETSPKSPWKWGLKMEFADQAAYDGYNGHADHVRFVKEVWLKEVSDFQEIDYVVVR